MSSKDLLEQLLPNSNYVLSEQQPPTSNEGLSEQQSPNSNEGLSGQQSPNSNEDLLEQQSVNSSHEVSECSELIVPTEQPPSSDSLFLPQCNNLDESTSINSDVGLAHVTLYDLQSSNLRSLQATPGTVICGNADRNATVSSSKGEEGFKKEKRPEIDTQPVGETKDVYIRNGDILRGEEATIAKALYDIEKTYSGSGSRSFRITLRDPESDKHQQVKDTADGIPQDGNPASGCQSASPSKESLSMESEDNKENTHQPREPNSALRAEVEIDNNSQHQPAPKSGIDISNDDTTMSNSQSHTGVNNGENDSSSLQVDSDSSEEDCDTDSSDFHLELTQNVNSISIPGDGNIMGQTDDNEPCSDCEEFFDFDTHRSIQQQVIQTGPKLITTINEHTRSKLSTSKEILEQKSTKAPAEVTAAKTDIKVVNEKFQCLTSETKVRGGEVCVATADAKVIDAKVQTGTVVNEVKGAELKVAAADIKGLKAQTGASINMTTKALTTTVGSVDLTAADVDIQATAEPTAQGVSCQGATATITGAREKAKVDVKATVSGVKVQGGVADIAGVKSGVTAEATAEATGFDTKIGTAQVSGIELSATASASASIGTEVSAANFRASGFDGVGAHASVKAKAGVEILSASFGISGTAGIYVSTTPRIGCISIAPGVPKIGIGSGFLNFGMGGVEGESGQYAGVATAGKSKGNAGHGNGHSGAGTGEGEGNGSSTGGNVEGNNILLGTSLSLGHGSSNIHSEFVHLNGSANGHSTLGNALPSETHSPSVTPEDSNNLIVGQEHKSSSNRAQSQSHVHHSDNSMPTEGCNAVSVDLSDQPFHLKAFRTLEQKHLGERIQKQGKSHPPSGPPAGHALLSGQGSDPKHHIQLHGAGAKLQAIVNERYPCLPGERKSESSASKNYQRCSSDSEIEHVKKSAIKRLNNHRKAGLRLGGTDSMSATKSSTNPSRKKAEPFGSRKHIYTLACFQDDESSKDIVKINSQSSEKLVAGFKDRDS